jgi:hypothetical protein
MTRTEHPPKTPRTITGLLGMLCALLHIQGMRASKVRLLVSLAGIATFFASTGTALAAGPESQPMYKRYE